VRLDEVTEMIDNLVGIVLTAMSGMAARCSPHDLTVRRRIDQVMFETRTAIANAAQAMADTNGEPPLDQQS
jgi:hypothetical protein